MDREDMRPKQDDVIWHTLNWSFGKNSVVVLSHVRMLNDRQDRVM